ncbi:hypothetical protein AVEN_30532-1 [Araneus ventricosus]|uniref:Uncharacterized protein n=1 Tax=Araneus ventricosus TaxID=182803 RepID=A0A4Y2J9N9_ARAVE|nr:hypothetical protein AVEN_30532-1 [Araneus ventricosus]
MKDRKVWELQELTDKSKVLVCCWDDKNKIKLFKARLVAQVFKQRKVCLNKWLHLQCDVKCAYPYTPLNPLTPSGPQNITTFVYGGFVDIWIREMDSSAFSPFLLQLVVESPLGRDPRLETGVAS